MVNFKSKLKLILKLVLIIILFTSCNKQVDIKEDTFKINNKFLLTKFSLHSIVLTDINSKILISEKVSEISFDSNYILIKQLGMKREYPDNTQNTYMIPDESKVNYWIINMADADEIHGPLDLNQYEELIKKEQIVNIQFKSVKEYIR